MKTYVTPLTEKQMHSWQNCICASGGGNQGGSSGGGSGSGVENNTQNPVTPGFNGNSPLG